MNKNIIILLLALNSSASFAVEPASYAGEETREIKALSASEIDAYLAGKGMGLAKAAELNGYPGPKHVLDLAKELALSNEQITKSNELFFAMQSNSKRLGARLIELEKELDRLFSSDEIDQIQLENILSFIAKINADIRRSHLGAHIEQKKLLSAHQVSLYSQLRGYTNSQESHDHHSQHH